MKRSSPFRLGSPVRLGDLPAVCAGTRPVALPAAARRRVAAARRAVEAAAASGRAVYGVNTGFGELALRRIPARKLRILQRNFVLSHACGVGPALSPEESRAILFLRANEFARGFSGVRPALVDLMVELLNAGVAPVVPSRGSVGASGDLAPQAHVALALIGEGEVWRDGRRAAAASVLEALGLKRASLMEKEGLSLCNGTQAMQAVGGLALLRARRVWGAAQLAGAMSLEALTGTPDPFREELQRLKPHPGQARAARGLRELLAGSQIRESHRENDPRVQDPYSLRCMPQVHGAVLGQLERARAVVEAEMASATDNPLVVGGRVRSGGNFHGQELAFAFDGACLALAALGNISERRVFQLTLGQAPRLSPFLARDPGLESGWMIPQYVAAALASETKTLAHPASADSIPTSANKEDFVSMGMGAALKLGQAVANAAQIVAIELLCAAQGLAAHAPLKPGRGVARGLELLRRRVPASRGDERLGPRLEAVRELVLDGYFEGAAP